MELHRDVVLLGRSLDWAVGQQRSVTATNQGHQMDLALKKVHLGASQNTKLFEGYFFDLLSVE